MASHRMNDVMRVLTVVSTVFMPLTFIVGIYGMNFEHMPELQWRSGYFDVMLLMLALSLAMIYGFRRRGWL
jgi:magnesium transporter